MAILLLRSQLALSLIVLINRKEIKLSVLFTSCVGVQTSQCAPHSIHMGNHISFSKHMPYNGTSGSQPMYGRMSWKILQILLSCQDVEQQEFTNALESSLAAFFFFLIRGLELRALCVLDRNSTA